MKKTILFFCLCLLYFPLFAQNFDLVVAQDGSGDYTTIQDAINAIRDYKPEGRQRIFVRKGVYEEKVIVPSYKTNITLVGEDLENTILVWHDHANMRTISGWGPATLSDEKEAQAIASTDKARKIGTFQSYTLRVDGPGFECENLTISNDAMLYYNPSWLSTRKDTAHIGQAVAVHVEADKVVFRNCRLLGFQDTLFTGNADSRQVYYNCYIEGIVDFIFGPATCWFEGCQIHAIANGYYTAASTPAEHPYGYVFYRCNLTADDHVTRTYLGRPWRNYAATTFAECEMCSAIAPEGWNNWNDPVRETMSRYREYGSTGPGARMQQRVSWSRILTAAEVANLSPNQVLYAAHDAWRSNFRPVDFYNLHFAFCDEYKQKGTSYVPGTLEPDLVSSHPETDIEPLVMRLDGVDCTTLVEYMSAAMLGRCNNPLPTDSIMQRFVQALRYVGGRRGNYATRKHYFTHWVLDNEEHQLLTEVTAQLRGAKSQTKVLNFMSTHPQYYPQLEASPVLVEQIRTIEQQLSQHPTFYLPLSAIRKNFSLLREGDIVAFVTNKAGLDVTHMGFVWLRDAEYDEPRLLHASSKAGRVVISDCSLLDFAAQHKGCIGIRVLRLNL